MATPRVTSPAVTDDSTHSRLWRTGAVVLALFGLVLLWFRQPVATTLAIPLAGSVAWSLAGVWRWTLAEEGEPPPRAPSFTKACALTAAGLGMLGLVLHDVGLGLAVMLALGLTSPAVTKRFRPASTAPVDQPPAPGCPDPEEHVGTDLPEMLSGLSDGELCRAWRRSFVLLHETRTEERLEVVALRAALLDEMTRRHPREVETWLASGGRAAGGPDRFFSDSD